MRAGRPESGLRPRRLPQPGALVPPALAVRLGAFADALGIWVERMRTRRRLAHLSDHMLKDIGVSRDDGAREAEKPFWRK